MDISAFKAGPKKAQVEAGPESSKLKKLYTKCKYWILPPTLERRRQRFSQIKDIAIFIVAVGLVWYNEKTIVKTLAEISQEAAGQVPF